MSDPVTNAEVEDVLSSIRRLVSEDKRPMQAFKPEPKAADISDRLVLTPALRVADAPEEEPSADIVDTPQSADDFARNVQQMTAAAETALSEVETDVENDSRDPVEADLHKLFEDETSNEEAPAPDHDYSDDPYGFADASDADGSDDEQSWLRRAPEEDDALEDDDAPVGTASLTAKIEALETAIGNISDTWEPDAPGEDDYSGTDAPAMSWEDETNDQPETAQQETPSQNDESNVAAMVDDTADEDEDTSPGIFASTRHHAADAPETADETAADQGFLLTSPASSADEAGEDDFDYEADDQVIDEEALRDLVSEIVRSELQGALGERITRNVRKLVRREIHRALTAQEME